MDIFDEIKSRLPMSEVARFYGYAPNKAGFIRCPFHNERTASLKLFETHFHCFGCGAHGDAISFVAGLISVDQLEAAKVLNRDFNLGYDLGRPPTAEEETKRRRRSDLNKTSAKFESWRVGTISTLNQTFFVAHNALKRAPEDWAESEERAVRFMPLLEFWCDELESGDMAQMIEVFRERKEVRRLCEMVLNSSQEKSKVG